jgi:hypothetical protein
MSPRPLCQFLYVLLRYAPMRHSCQGIYLLSIHYLYGGRVTDPSGEAARRSTDNVWFVSSHSLRHPDGSD